MATFDSAAIFGRGVQISSQLNPREEQQAATPGVNGKGTLDLGNRGRVFTVKGALFGDTAADLNFALRFFESYWDGNLYILEDTFGNFWPYVKLKRFQPEQKIHQDFSGRGYFCLYDAEFEQLRGA